MELDRIIAVRTDKAVYHDGDCAVKVFGSDFCKAKIFREAFYQTQLEATSLNVPPVEKICQIDDKWAIFSRYIRGKTLEQEMLETPEDMEKHIGKLVKVQLKIHEAISPDANFPNMKKELLQRLTCARLPEETICRLKTVLETLPEERRLCHGDFNPSNIIYTAKGEAYILDWARVCMGNPAADAAETYFTLLLEYSKEIADTYFNRYCTESGIGAFEITQWFPIIAACCTAKADQEQMSLLLAYIK